MKMIKVKMTIIVMLLLFFVPICNVEAKIDVDSFVNNYNQAANKLHSSKKIVSNQLYAIKDEYGELNYCLFIGNKVNNIIFDKWFSKASITFSGSNIYDCVEVPVFVLMGVGCSDMLQASKTINSLINQLGMDNINKTYGVGEVMLVDEVAKCKFQCLAHYNVDIAGNGKIKFTVARYDN